MRKYFLIKAKCILFIIISFSNAGSCHKIAPETTTELNPTPSKICKGPHNYNISALTEVPYWAFNINSNCAIETNLTDTCTLYMSFCKTIESLIDCEGSSACIRYPNLPRTSIIAGNYTPNPFVAFERDKFLTEYLPGITVYNKFAEKYCLISISMEFVCDLDSVWEIPPENQPGIAPKPINFKSFTNTSCQIKITVPYSGACSTEKNRNGNISGGSVILIIFFVLLSIYVFFGLIYNVFVSKQSGIKALPHFRFWSSVILYSLEGSIITWRFLTCEFSRKNKRKYESI